ncbi:hypothetical protein HX744_06180 [Pseudonocardia sp. ICBG1122]|nr:hypothetical protein [Pseudonocardia pini]
MAGGATELPDSLQKFFKVTLGMEWPEGDEEGLREISEAWAEFGKALAGAESEAITLASDLADVFEGETASLVHDMMRTDATVSLSQLAGVADEMRKSTKNAAADIEKGKVMLIVMAALALAAVIELIATIVLAWMAAAVNAAARVALSAILSGMVKAVAQAAGRLGFNAFTARLLGRGLFETLKRMALYAGLGTSLLTAVDGFTQMAQVDNGSREGYDLALLGSSAVAGAIGGAGAGLVRAGAGGIRSLTGTSLRNINRHRATGTPRFILGPGLQTLGHLGYAGAQVLAAPAAGMIINGIYGGDDNPWFGAIGALGAMHARPGRSLSPVLTNMKRNGLGPAPFPLQGFGPDVVAWPPKVHADGPLGGTLDELAGRGLGRTPDPLNGFGPHVGGQVTSSARPPAVRGDENSGGSGSMVPEPTGGSVADVPPGQGEGTAETGSARRTIGSPERPMGTLFSWPEPVPRAAMSIGGITPDLSDRSAGPGRADASGLMLPDRGPSGPNVPLAEGGGSGPVEHSTPARISSDADGPPRATAGDSPLRDASGERTRPDVGAVEDGEPRAEPPSRDGSSSATAGGNPLLGALIVGGAPGIGGASGGPSSSSPGGVASGGSATGGSPGGASPVREALRTGYGEGGSPAAVLPDAGSSDDAVRPGGGSGTTFEASPAEPTGSSARTEPESRAAPSVPGTGGPTAVRTVGSGGGNDTTLPAGGGDPRGGAGPAEVTVGKDWYRSEHGPERSAPPVAEPQMPFSNRTGNGERPEFGEGARISHPAPQREGGDGPLPPIRAANPAPAGTPPPRIDLRGHTVHLEAGADALSESQLSGVRTMADRWVDTVLRNAAAERPLAELTVTGDRAVDGVSGRERAGVVERALRDRVAERAGELEPHGLLPGNLSISRKDPVSTAGDEHAWVRIGMSRDGAVPGVATGPGPSRAGAAKVVPRIERTPANVFDEDLPAAPVAHVSTELVRVRDTARVVDGEHPSTGARVVRMAGDSDGLVPQFYGRVRFDVRRVEVLDEKGAPVWVTVLSVPIRFVGNPTAAKGYRADLGRLVEDHVNERYVLPNGDQLLVNPTFDPDARDPNVITLFDEAGRPPEIAEGDTSPRAMWWPASGRMSDEDKLHELFHALGLEDRYRVAGAALAGESDQVGLMSRSTEHAFELTEGDLVRLHDLIRIAVVRDHPIGAPDHRDVMYGPSVAPTVMRPGEWSSPARFAVRVNPVFYDLGHLPLSLLQEHRDAVWNWVRAEDGTIRVGVDDLGAALSDTERDTVFKAFGQDFVARDPAKAEQEFFDALLLGHATIAVAFMSHGPVEPGAPDARAGGELYWSRRYRRWEMNLRSGRYMSTRGELHSPAETARWVTAAAREVSEQLGVPITPMGAWHAGGELPTLHPRPAQPLPDDLELPQTPPMWAPDADLDHLVGPALTVPDPNGLSIAPGQAVLRDASLASFEGRWWQVRVDYRGEVLLRQWPPASGLEGYVESQYPEYQRKFPRGDIGDAESFVRKVYDAGFAERGVEITSEGSLRSLSLSDRFIGYLRPQPDGSWELLNDTGEFSKRRLWDITTADLARWLENIGQRISDHLDVPVLPRVQNQFSEPAPLPTVHPTRNSPGREGSRDLAPPHSAGDTHPDGEPARVSHPAPRRERPTGPPFEPEPT